MNMRLKPCMTALWSVLLLCLGFTSLSAYASPWRQVAQTAPEPSKYEEITNYLGDLDHDNWLSILWNLRTNISNCQEDFCTDVDMVNYKCSVETATGQIQTCIWTLATTKLEEKSGNFKTLQWQCPTQLVPGTTANSLLVALLTGRTKPWQAQLPGTDHSLYDGVKTCLSS